MNTPANTGIHQFELVDSRGQSHSYLVNEHPAGEGMEIMYALLGLGAPTAGALAGAALKSEQVVRAVLAVVAGESEDRDLRELLAGLDLSEIGPAVSLALNSGRAPDLTRKILSRTYRDGKVLVGAQFEISFQANYAEMLAATWRVCQINHFFPLPTTSLASPSATKSRPQGLPHGG